MRILYIHRTRARDGQSVHIDELIAAFAAEGHEVEMVGPQRVAAMESGLERRLLPAALYEPCELAFSIMEFFRLLRAALKRKPDLIYQRANLHMLSALWLSRLLRLPLFVEVNAPLAEERGRFGGLSWPRLARWSEHLLWRGATKVLPVTRVLADKVEQAGVAGCAISVIANGVNQAQFAGFHRDRAKRALGLEGRLVLGFVGYVRAWHGLEQVVELLGSDPRLAQAHFMVIGDGPALAPLSARARDLGIADRVRLVGIVDRDDIAGMTAAFDIALQPEVTEYASPLKLFEYMIQGHAIVAPDMANIREVLSDGRDALLFRAGDRQAFAAAIAHLAGDQDLRRRLGEGARQNIARENRTWRGNARQIVAMAQELSPAGRAALSVLAPADQA